MSHVYHHDSRSFPWVFPGSGNTTGDHTCRFYTAPPYQPPPPPPPAKRTRAQFETPVFPHLPPYQNHGGLSFTQPKRQQTVPPAFLPAYGTSGAPVVSAVPNPGNLGPAFAGNPGLVAPNGLQNPVPVSQRHNGHSGWNPVSAVPPQQTTPFSRGQSHNFAQNPGTTLLPPLPLGPPPVSARIEPISGASVKAMAENLLKALLAQQATPTILQKQPTPIIQEEEEEPLGFDFDPAKLKKRNESVIRALHGDLPRQCASCGTRFKTQEEHKNHMDWHLRKNRETKNLKKKQMISRNWFLASDLILTAAEASNASVPFFKGLLVSEEIDHEEITVSADFDQRECAMCKDAFEDFWSDEKDDWLYRGAVYMNLPFGSVEGIDRSQLGPIVHVKCIAKPGQKPGQN